MNKMIVSLLAASLIVSNSIAFGAIKEGSFTVTPLVGGYVFDGGKFLDSTFLMGIRGGYNFTKSIGIEALYDYTSSTESKSGLTDISLKRYGGQALYHFFPDSVFVPYLAAGYSSLKFDGNGINNNLHGAFDYGLGAKYFVTDSIALRGDVRHIHFGYDSGTYNDMEYTLGIYFQFGAAEPAMKAIAPPPVPEPVKIVAAPEPVKIVAAPEPVKIVAAPVPVILPVPTPPKDSDGDGVNDLLDRCPGTPQGVAVDNNGCQLDSDRDGVPDPLDKCLATPVGVTVDNKGCPIDSDNDGVANYLDKCPGTLTGVAVSSNGCPLEAAKKFCNNPTTIAVFFDTNKAEIKADYHDELDKLGNFLKEFPSSKGSIEGHTDADGSKSANQNLSQSRANNIRNYIINKFEIDASRIYAKGYGSEKPVASNKTAAGKAKNRRIETIFNCK